MHRIYSQYYVPRTKGELIKAIKPLWAGRKGVLQEMSIRHLRAIFHRMRQNTIRKLVSRDDIKT